MAYLFFHLEVYEIFQYFTDYNELRKSSFKRYRSNHTSVKAKGHEPEFIINQSLAGKSRNKNSGYYKFYSTLNLNEINKISIF